MIGCSLLPYVCGEMPRRLIFVVAIFGFSISCFLLGPSLLFHLPENPMFLFLSFLLQGFFMVLIFVPIIPEIIERV